MSDFGLESTFSRQNRLESSLRTLAFARIQERRLHTLASERTGIDGVWNRPLRLTWQEFWMICWLQWRAKSVGRHLVKRIRSGWRMRKRWNKQLIVGDTTHRRRSHARKS